jgi:peptidyl-prolyl isomerase D
MANMGPDTNTAHFSIMAAPAPHLDGAYTIFGQVVAGLDVVDAVNALARGQPDNTATAAAGARIAECGELRRGTLAPDLEQDA